MSFWSKKFEQIKDILHRTTLPGFKGIPIAIILKYLWKEIWRDDIVTRANSIAFSFFLSIFPAILVFLSLLPYLPIGNMVKAFRRTYVEILPKNMSDYVDTIIIEMTETNREGLLSISIVLALIFASNGVLSMIKGFHKSYETTYKKQNTFQQRWRALKLTILLGMLFIASLATIISGRSVMVKFLTFTGVDPDNYRLYNFIRWFLIFIFYYVCITIIYRIGPAYKNKEKLFSPGATLATILSIISSLGFAVWVENFSQYNEIYGSIGTVILILLWLQINSFIILLGYELNASIAINRDLLAYKRGKLLFLIKKPSIHNAKEGLIVSLSLNQIMKHLFLLTQLCVLTTTFIYGQAKYSNEFLTLGVGGRAHGMGGAVSASVSDLSASYWNPAGMTAITSVAQFHAMHAEWFAGIAQYDQISFGKKLNPESQSYGSISLIRMGIDNIPNTLRLIGPDGSINYDRITTFSAADYAAFISYARKLGQGNWYAGGSVKIIHRSIGEFGKSWGFGADLGVQYRKEKFTLALMGRDLTTTFNNWNFTLSDEDKEIFTQTGNEIPVSTLEQTLPTFILAGSYKFKIGTQSAILAEMDFDITTDGKRNTLISSETISVGPRMGVEFDLRNRIFLRGGVSNFQKVKDITDPTQSDWTFQPNAGIGLRLGRLHLDYAFTNIGDVTGTQLYSHIFGLILDFADLTPAPEE